MVTRQQTRRRIIELAAVIAIAVVLTAADPVHEFLRHIVEQASAIIEEHPIAGRVVFVVLSTLSAMLAFVSSAVVVPVAVYTWGRGETLLLLWVSWLLGGTCAYAIGRSAGRRIASWIVSSERVDYYSERITAGADFVTVLLFQLALPSEIPGYVLGAARFRFPLYLLALAIAELPFAIGAVYLGEGFLRRDYTLLIGFGIAGILFSTFAFYRLHRRLKSQGNAGQRTPAAGG